MSDKPPLVELNELESGELEVALHENAPEDFVEWANEDETKFERVVRFVMATHRSDVAEQGEIHLSREYAEKEHQLMLEAVESGDIEAAQEHKHLSDTFDDVADMEFEALLNGELTDE